MKPTYFASPARFRAWLAKHHASAAELLVGFHKKGSGKPSIDWPESVDEALCFGWIDGVRRRIDDQSYSIRFSPRRPTSHWSRKNVARVAVLKRAGRMEPAGLKAFRARKPEPSDAYSFERAEAVALSPAQLRKLRANREAAAFFAAQPPGYRRTATFWVVIAKREETRERRLARLIAECAAGRRFF